MPREKFCSHFRLSHEHGGATLDKVVGFYGSGFAGSGHFQGGLCVWCKAGECGMDRMGLVDAALLAACSPPPQVTAENADDGNEL